MEEDKANPNSQPPSPSPSWSEDQVPSWHLEGAVGCSDLLMSETEEEGVFVNMDEERKDNMDQEACLCEEVRELFPWSEDVTVWCKVGMRVQWQDGREKELYEWEESTTVQELYQWDEDDDKHQELSQWEDVRDPELSQWKGEGEQELSLLEDVRGHPHMYQWEVDKRDPEFSQVGVNSDKEPLQGKDYNVQELPQWQNDVSDQKLSRQEESISSQGLSQWGADASYKNWDKPSHTENYEDAQPCAQQRLGSPSTVDTEVSGEAARELPGASSALKNSTEAEPAAVAALAGAAEEVELPEPLVTKMEKAPDSHVLDEEVPLAGTESPVPAPHSPPGGSQALLDLAQGISYEVVLQAVVEIRASGQQPEEQEDLDQSMAAELEAAAPVEREEGALAGDLELFQCDKEENPELSQQEMNKYREVSQEEASTGQELSPGEVGSYQELSPEEVSTGQELSPGQVSSYHELSQGEASSEQELSPGEVGSYHELSQVEASSEQELSPGQVGSSQELSQGGTSSEQELSPGEVGSYHELSQGGNATEQQLFPGGASSYQELSQGGTSTEQELSPGGASSYLEFTDWEVRSSQKLSNWEEKSEQELFHKVISYQELSDWEESTGQELSEEEDSIGQEVSKGNSDRHSVQFSWKNDKEQMQDRWEHVSVQSTRVKPLPKEEEDEWDELSIFELSDEEDRERRLRCLTEDGLPVPVPREAWAEPQELEPRPQVPLCAWTPHLRAQALRRRVFSAAFEEQVPEVGTESPVPGLHSCPRCSAAQPGTQALSWQPAPHTKQPSDSRRVLRMLCSLVCCPCLVPPLED